MTATQAHHHRATLKQQNKPFKSRHSTKSSLKDAAKGRVARQSPKVASTNTNAAQLRSNRRNAAKLVQTKKRQSLVGAIRLFSGVEGTPRIVAVVPLCPDVTARQAVQALAKSLDADADDCPEEGSWKLKAERFKTSLQFVLLPYRRLYDALDACKAADYTLFVLSPTTEVEPWGDLLLRTLQAQGLPEVVSVVAGPIVQKERTGILKSLLSFVQYFVPSQTRVFALDAPSDATNAIRTLCEGRPSDVRWREGRPWVLADSVAMVDGMLSVTGVVRGAGLNANRLVHIPGQGDFQIAKIVSAPLPRRGMDVESTLLAERVPDEADSLVSTNEPDTMANEQTWPTEEEMADAPAASGDVMPDAPSGTTPRRVKRVPKGTSEYQAAWILDDDDEEEDGDGEDGDGDEELGEDEEMEDMPIADVEPEEEDESQRGVHFEDLPMEEEKEQLDTWRSRSKAEEEDIQFPDEIDTPQDIPARTRFQRFRGLRSFRTSPWDAYENLPVDYARIFQFEDFKRTERTILRKAEEEEDAGVVAEGTRVTVFIEGAPEMEWDGKRPFVIFGLFRHEHKMSVLNFTVQRNTEYSEPVRSKDSLILAVGPRRFAVNPIFSQHSARAVNKVYKFERFLKHGVTSVATVFAPVVFGTQPCLMLKETADLEEPRLVAMGTFLNPDPTRIIAKRIVLTGHPYKVHKKTATIRYMFFNPEDVMYYKPIQLHTKYGRVGHIKESLGTHGYFKAHFDNPINQMDTVCMSLYKRVFPKWATLWKPGATNGDETMMEE
ncbi:ribosome biogenesis protein tsr1 [Exidia glandulosa HHB12029]|uniref:Ribosome biogenesis protein tsr1 n=1 Tax=Exidia glandulosa HHB12029 TaxID=1314781 RepID=A0A165NMF1_EXIGL|nr:ribosome biogenesis protein tsr1 [Exidia glandulosa HHB12029]